MIDRDPRRRLAATTRCLLWPAAALLPAGMACAQTSVEGVPANRPDQNPMRAPSRGGPTPTNFIARNPNAPIAPFQLRGASVAGATLPPPQVEAAYAPFVGRTIDNKTLTDITDAVASAYGKSDVALYEVLVPQQDFAGGILRLVAVEGYIESVEVRGKLRHRRLALLRSYLRRIEQERPLHTSTLQRVVSLIRDLPGFFPDLSFERGHDQGAVKLVVTAHEKPVQLSLGISDRGTAFLGRTQVQADAYVNGVLGGGDQLRGTLVLPTHVDRFQYYALGYSTPLDTDGTTLSLDVSHLRTRPAAFPLKGSATAFGLQLSRPLIRSYKRNLYLTLGLDGIDVDNALLGFTLSDDRIRATRLAASYSYTAARNELSLSGTASFGLDVLGARVLAGQSDQRFRKVNLKGSDAQQIGKTFVLRVSGFGQLTPDRLPASEQIALGGDEFGRAYEAAIIAGDYGFAGSGELAWRPRGLPKLVDGSELYAFGDGGKIWYRSRFGFAGFQSHIQSVGGGIRLHVVKRAVVQIEASRGLTNPVFYEDREKWRALFSIRTIL
ncbi:MAG: ShlB/FhaC/HecB family hemolysin secretion/activation protein [Sphingomonadaceae bacterium]|nr:ShlB/FhaC/HecB family hemolysin secretion/activation protein [Sphingomonadaceae bacterium]